MEAPPHLLLGTAGWNVPAACRAQVGGEGSHLMRYARAMSAVEINTSFYKPHRRQTYEKWSQATPAAFRFSVKVPQTITHEDDFRSGDVARFVDETSGLGNKLAVYLVQFPPSKGFNEQSADALFSQLQDRTSVTLVCEPRHASWFTKKVDQWFAERKISRVAADPARNDSGDVPGGWPGLRYYRLHGSPRIYYSSYDERFLHDLEQRLTALRPAVDTWCIFDNTAAGAAFGNVLELKRLIIDRC
jgi:uncharacterized protein YecE (DUF72 family)